MKTLKQSILFFLVLIICTCTLQATSIDPNKWYQLESKLGGLHLDVPGKSQAPKKEIWVWGKTNGSNQQWMFSPVGDGYFFIISRNSGLVLDVRHSSKKSGATIWQYPLNKSDAQKWKPVAAGGGYYYLRSKVSKQYLTVNTITKKAENGTKVVQYPLSRGFPFDRRNAQQWKLKVVRSNTTLTIDPIRKPTRPRTDSEKAEAMMDRDGFYIPGKGFPIFFTDASQFKSCQNCKEPRVVIGKVPDGFNGFVADQPRLDVPNEVFMQLPGPGTIGDKVSSVYIPENSGYSVTLFEHKHFNGRRIILRKSVTDLRAFKFNDITSSFLLKKEGRGYILDTRTPIAYGKSLWKGKSMRLRTSIADLNSKGMGNTISSIKVPYGYRVILYDGKNFTGKSYTMENKHIRQSIDLKRIGMSDRVESIKIVKLR
ncbi:MAG: RICIN domain-containing protein [Saprospiraceae bacterium]|nr:RICIN domain-containing protein [Saprospiraceae bacterium]